MGDIHRANPYCGDALQTIQFIPDQEVLASSVSDLAVLVSAFGSLNLRFIYFVICTLTPCTLSGYHSKISVAGYVFLFCNERK